MVRWPRFIALAGVLALAAPGTASAQHPQVREGFWIGFGLGYGSFGVSDCDDCGREGSVTGFLKLGGKLSERWLLGFESNTWVDQEAGITVSMGTATATAYYYPKPEGGLHLKGGLGLGHLDVEDFGDETGLGLLIGVGHDFRVGRNISIVPGLSWYLGDFEGGSINVFQVGAGVTFH